jgi:hypothetical protein
MTAVNDNVFFLPLLNHHTVVRLFGATGDAFGEAVEQEGSNESITKRQEKLKMPSACQEHACQPKFTST